MSNKKQPYINKAPPIELGSAPPRYQPPPQVTSSTGILKNYPSSQSIAPTSKDVKLFPAPVAIDGANKQLYPPPQYPNPPPVVQPPHRRPSGPASGLPQEEDLRLGPVDMLKFVRKAEGDAAARVSSDARETARRLQSYTNEVRVLKEANQRLSDDNQELRDLCCFLDDDRQKGRKLAREWQRFGRYTASVMRQEVSTYQIKLRELENKQQDLIKDNLELKELCLYLDEERNQNTSTCPCGLRSGPRDDGDGSSSSTNADEPPLPVHVGANRIMEESMRRQRTVFNDQMIQYVRGLEQRVKQLESEKQALQLKLDQVVPPPVLSDTVSDRANGTWDPNDPCGGARPEAVVQALQVLEVREQLERNPGEFESLPVVVEGFGAGVVDHAEISGPDLDDGEKALVREMCNVVWRKLEEGPASRR